LGEVLGEPALGFLIQLAVEVPGDQLDELPYGPARSSHRSRLAASCAGEVLLEPRPDRRLTAVLERSTYVPALNDTSFNGGDDFLGSAPRAAVRLHQRADRASNPRPRGSTTWPRTPW
jgi:hypothetical protein